VLIRQLIQEITRLKVRFWIKKINRYRVSLSKQDTKGNAMQEFSDGSDWIQLNLDNTSGWTRSLDVSAHLHSSWDQEEARKQSDFLLQRPVWSESISRGETFFFETEPMNPRQYHTQSVGKESTDESLLHSCCVFTQEIPILSLFSFCLT